jgi:hypothetical protein
LLVLKLPSTYCATLAMFPCRSLMMGSSFFLTSCTVQGKSSVTMLHSLRPAHTLPAAGGTPLLPPVVTLLATDPPLHRGEAAAHNDPLLESFPHSRPEEEPPGTALESSLETQAVMAAALGWGLEPGTARVRATGVAQLQGSCLAVSEDRRVML